MRLPEDYPDLLADEVAPFGLEFRSIGEDEDGGALLEYVTDPESFEANNPSLGIAESYGAEWPPEHLVLRLRFDRHGDPLEASFEVFDLFSWAASVDPALHDRLNTMADPADHAVAVGEALRLVTQRPDGGADFLD